MLISSVWLTRNKECEKKKKKVSEFPTVPGILYCERNSSLRIKKNEIVLFNSFYFFLSVLSRKRVFTSCLRGLVRLVGRFASAQLNMVGLRVKESSNLLQIPKFRRGCPGLPSIGPRRGLVEVRAS